MAIYQYACINCDIDVEFERSINDPEPEYMCETCGYKLIRQFTTAGTIFKGGGFYKTDSRAGR